VNNIVRLNRYIASSGLCSRRAADILIDELRVKVNGILANKGTYVNDSDTVEVDGKILKKENLIYIAINKPKRFLTACSDSRSKVILDLVDIDERLFPLGRLDIDTEGLLILSNDGDLFNRVMHPRAAIWKEYIVDLDRPPLKDDLYKIEKGVYIKKFEYTTLPAKIKDVIQNRLSISIREGKKRQIKRVFSSLGYKVKYLKRVSIGDIKLGDLKLGSYRYLTEVEINYLKGI
jgi:23S rRNA pseudouridine2605 synthase